MLNSKYKMLIQTSDVMSNKCLKKEKIKEYLQCIYNTQ